LKERYPVLARELADLLGRIKANNERCRQHYLPLVEHVARGMRPTDVNFLTAAVRLPNLDNHAAGMGIRYWPPTPPPISAADVLPPHVIEGMRLAGEEARRTTEAGLALHEANRGKSTKRLSV
jgi:hypothetical protein